MSRESEKIELAKWFRENAAPSFAGSLLFDEPLAKHTYYRIGGPAAVLAVPKDETDLELIGKGIRETGTEYAVMGAGSNLLVSDEGYPGLVIKTSRLRLSIDPQSDRLIRTGAGIAISTLLRRAAQGGWGGIEFLTGIPGSVGGAVAMNAGTHLGETKSMLKRVMVFLPDSAGTSGSEQASLRTFEAADLRFDYRKNLFLPRGAIVVSADWEVRPDDPARVKEVIDSTLVRRKATQPLDAPSCGSVFKNPRAHGMEAWQVIEKLGLRGHRIGNAQISEKHSNWILNLGGAKAADVQALIDLVKTRSAAELGVPMEEEVVRLPARATK